MLLLACGSNAKGQLGVGDSNDKHTFTSCFFDMNSGGSPESTVIAAAFGSNHTVVLCENIDSGKPRRTLWGVGDGDKGQLGQRTDSSQANSFHFMSLNMKPPKRFSNGSTIAHVAACWETTYVVYRPSDNQSSNMSDACLAMGANDFGDLGVAPSTSSSITSSTKKRASTSPSSITSVEISFVSALQSSELPLSSRSSPVYRIDQIASGLHHVICALIVELNDGAQREVLVGWGASRHGQSELHEHGDHITAPSSSLSPSPSPASRGKRRSNGTVPFQQAPIHLFTLPPGEKVLSMGLGQHHSVVLLRRANGTTRILYGGSNRKGQLSFSSEVSTIPLRSVRCTWNATFLEGTTQRSLSNSGSSFQILGIGSGERGQLGRNLALGAGTSPNAHPEPSASSTLPAVQSTNNNGLQHVDFPFLVKNKVLQSFKCGSEHAIAIVSNAENGEREAWAWGWNEHGNIGLGHTDDVTTPTRIWPEERSSAGTVGGELRDVWAGNGTTWLLIG